MSSTSSSSSSSSSFIIPLIQLHAPDQAEQVARLRQACLTHGFFYLDAAGGVTNDVVFDQVLQQTKALFDLPEPVKQQLSDSVLSRGYTGVQEETLDPQVQVNLGGDTKEGYYIADDILPNDNDYNPAKLMGPNVWPSEEITHPYWTREQCHQFRSVMEEYYQTMCLVGLQVVRLLALAIGLDDDEHYFDKYFTTSPRAALRLLHYPPIPSQPDQGLFGCGAHSDYGMITLLWTDGTPGLQILLQQQHQQQRPTDINDDKISTTDTKDEQWIDVPPPPSKQVFIVNLGDMLERWTNGMFKSTKHRVVMRPNDGDHTTHHRYSIPFFYEPHFDTVVECLPVCCSDDRPAMYPPVISGEYLLNKYRQTHADFTPMMAMTEEEQPSRKDVL